MVFVPVRKHHAEQKPEYERDEARPEHHEHRVAEGLIKVRQLACKVRGNVNDQLLHL